MHQILQRVALDIKFTIGPVFHQGGDFVHIVGANMALVRPRMHRDAIGASLQAHLGGAAHARNVEVAGVAQQRDLIDVDGQHRLRKLRR